MAYDKYTHASYTDLDVKYSGCLIRVKAIIRLKTAEEGGRESGVRVGYRPNHVFEYQENGEMVEAFWGSIGFEEQEMLELGKEYKVVIIFPLSQRIERFMKKGRKWWLHEDRYVVGEAEFIEFELPQTK